MLRIITLLILLTALEAGGYFFFLSPEAALKRQVQLKLTELSQAVETQDASKVRATLTDILHDSSQIDLAVYFPIPGQKRQPKTPDRFGKPEFIGLIDNTLYTVNDYHFTAWVDTVVVSQDKATAQVDFTAESTARGASSLLMETNAQFTLPAVCHATLLLGAKPSVSALDCDVEIRR